MYPSHSGDFYGKKFICNIEWFQNGNQRGEREVESALYFRNIKLIRLILATFTLCLGRRYTEQDGNICERKFCHEGFKSRRRMCTFL